MQETTQAANEEVTEIDLGEIFGLLLHRIWLILAGAGAVGAVGFILSFFVIAPKYESTTKIIILNRQNESTLTYSDMQLASQLTKDYEELIVCRDVLEQVIAECGLEDSYEELMGRIAVTNKSDTRIIGITVTDTDPARAQYIANTVRDVATQQIVKVTDVEAVNTVDSANLPEKKSSPSVKMWTAAGALLGMAAVCAAVIIKYLLDDSVKTAEDVEKYLGTTALALIPVMEKSDGEEKHRVRKREKEKTAKTAPKRKKTARPETDGIAIEEIIRLEGEGSGR